MPAEDINKKYEGIEVWGGIECTIVRLNDVYKDQLETAGHYAREDDLQQIANLGIKAMRYPVLWEKHHTNNWGWVTKQLNLLRRLHIKPIAGLLHHGSGPAFTSLIDGDFPQQLAAYAQNVAKQFPWMEYYTPVNEPITTARFAGLYGFWYPHHANDNSFLRMLLNELKGTVLAMAAIRQINPAAKLVQTEDLAKTHSTPLLKYQADFENNRRWLTYDLLCGKLDTGHALWDYFINNGISEAELNFFIENPCPPAVAGFNHYVTSERYLDENIGAFTGCVAGSNGIHAYADTEAVRTTEYDGIQKLLVEAWSRYHLPMAITEVQLNCSREEQLRWFKEIWDACRNAKHAGVDIKAVTAWSLLGAYDWDSLLRQHPGHYESGAFDISNKNLRPTAVSKMIKSLANHAAYDHPLLHASGWWHRHNPVNKTQEKKNYGGKAEKQLVIIGKNGTLANAFAKICEQRGIAYKALSRQDVDVTKKESIKQMIDVNRPWAIINTAGYVLVDDAETDVHSCFALNAMAPALLADACRVHGMPFMTFSSDLVFGGDKHEPYMETDKVFPLNIYGKSKAEGEAMVLGANPAALVIRTSAFFGPWDKYNFAYYVINSLSQQAACSTVSDVIVSPTYVPDLVHACLNLFIDDESGIWHLSNDGNLTWTDFARQIAGRAGYVTSMITDRTQAEMGWKANRPAYSALKSERGIMLPTLQNAIERYFLEKAV